MSWMIDYIWHNENFCQLFLANLFLTLKIYSWNSVQISFSYLWRLTAILLYLEQIKSFLRADLFKRNPTPFTKWKRLIILFWCSCLYNGNAFLGFCYRKCRIIIKNKQTKIQRYYGVHYVYCSQLSERKHSSKLHLCIK